MCACVCVCVHECTQAVLAQMDNECLSLSLPTLFMPEEKVVGDRMFILQYNFNYITKRYS